MIRLFQRLLLFSGLQKKRLIRSFLAYLVSSFFEMIPIMAILTVLTGILKQLSGDVMPESTIWISLGIMIVSIVGRIVFVNLSANARTLGSFAFGSEKRMEIGERLKKAPMGYFNENRLGDITAAVTAKPTVVSSSARTSSPREPVRRREQKTHDSSTSPPKPMHTGSVAPAVRPGRNCRNIST